MKICVIEDESGIAGPIKQVLEKHGFAVDGALDGEEGLRLAMRNSYDCLIVDIQLPKLSGLELLSKLRLQNIMTPVIILTARSQIYDKLEGFEHGADDYMTKPFHMEELLARVRAVIKRKSANKSETLTLGTYTLHPEQNSLVDESQSTHKHITLTTKESAVLEYLLRHPNQIISTEEILEHVWDSEVNLFTDTVKTHIKTLRQKIDPKKHYLVTIRGKGYSIRQPWNFLYVQN